MKEKTVIAADILSQDHIYKKMVDELEDYSIIILDPNGTVKSWNKGAEKIKGYLADEILGKNYSVFYTEKDRQAHLPERYIEEAKEKNKVVSEGWRLRKDGSLIWVNGVLSALHDDDGHIIGFTKIMRDYTDKKAQDEQAKFLSSIVQNIQDPIISTDTNGLITDWNKSAEEVLGWKKEEALGKMISILLNINYVNVDRAQILKSFDEKGYWHGEIVYHAKSGIPIDVLVTASHLKNADGIISGSVVVARDITQRKKAELALEKLNNDLERRIKDRTQEIFEASRRFQSLVENDYTITSMISENYETIYRSAAESWKI